MVTIGFVYRIVLRPDRERVILRRGAGPGKIITKVQVQVRKALNTALLKNSNG